MSVGAPRGSSTAGPSRPASRASACCRACSDALRRGQSRRWASHGSPNTLIASAAQREPPRWPRGWSPLALPPDVQQSAAPVVVAIQVGGDPDPPCRHNERDDTVVRGRAPGLDPACALVAPHSASHGPTHAMNQVLKAIVRFALVGPTTWVRGRPAVAQQQLSRDLVSRYRGRWIGSSGARSIVPQLSARHVRTCSVAHRCATVSSRARRAVIQSGGGGPGPRVPPGSGERPHDAPLTASRERERS